MTSRDAVLLYLFLEARGFMFRLDGERFHVEPKGRLDEDEVAAIRRHRDGLFELIRQREEGE